MKLSLDGKALMCLGLMGLSAGAFINAMQWPLQARLFPMIVSVPLFVLCAVEFAFNVFGTKEQKGSGGMDFQISGDHDPALARKRTLGIFLWCLVFFAMVLVVGFAVSVPLFVFLYLKPHSKEGWTISFVLSFVAWAIFYGLFIKLLNVPFGTGWLQQGLKALGVF